MASFRVACQLFYDAANGKMRVAKLMCKAGFVQAKPATSSRCDGLTAHAGCAARGACVTEVALAERKAQTTLDTEATRILYAARPAR